MREIDAKLITEKVAELCISANCFLPSDVRKKIEEARDKETSPVGKGILEKLIENADVFYVDNADITRRGEENGSIAGKKRK